MAKVRTPPIYTTPQDAALAFYHAFEARDLDAMMSTWADDEEIVCVHPGGPRLVGFDAIRNAWEQLFSGDVRLKFRIEQPIEFDRGDELTEPFVQKKKQKAIESDALIEQPVKGCARHQPDHAVTQCDDIVKARLVLEQRPFAEPAARRYAGEGHGLAAVACLRNRSQTNLARCPVGCCGTRGGIAGCFCPSRGPAAFMD